MPRNKSEYYYVIRPDGTPCGHAHDSLNAKLAKCYLAGRGPRGVRTPGKIWHVGLDGFHKRIVGAALEPLHAFMPTRGRGRPAGQAPLTEQGKPLYARLSVAKRRRYDAVATRHGMELGDYALHLLEAAAQEEDASDARPAPVTQALPQKFGGIRE